MPNIYTPQQNKALDNYLYRLQQLHRRLGEKEKKIKEIYEESKGDLKLFTKTTFHEVRGRESFKPHWSLDYILEHLQLVGTEIDQLLISLPRGYGKSVLISEIFPAFKLIQNPSERLTCFTRSFGSNASSWHRNCFANYNSDKIKQYIHNEGHEASCSETIFRTKAGGYRRVGSINSSAVGSDLTGVVVDDPVSEEHQRSEALRESVEAFYRRGLFPAIRRVPAEVNVNQLTEEQKEEYKLTLKLQSESKIINNKTPWIVHTMQRLHPDDPQQMMLNIKEEIEKANIKQNILYIAIPAKAPEPKTYILPISKQVYTTATGEYLEAGTLNKDRIDLLEIQLGTTANEAQMQQNPIESALQMVKVEWFNYYDCAPSDLDIQNIFITTDLAFTQKKTSDYSVICCFGVSTKKDLYLLDMIRDRTEYSESRQVFINFKNKWNKIEFLQLNTRYLSAFYIEDTTPSKPLISDLKMAISCVTEVKRTQDKVARLESCINEIQNGKVYLPKGKTYVSDILTEFAMFKRSMTHKHDDIVDCFVDGITYGLKENTSLFAGIAEKLKEAGY